MSSGLARRRVCGVACGDLSRLGLAVRPGCVRLGDDRNPRPTVVDSRIKLARIEPRTRGWMRLGQMPARLGQEIAATAPAFTGSRLSPTLSVPSRGFFVPPPPPVHSRGRHEPDPVAPARGRVLFVVEQTGRVTLVECSLHERKQAEKKSPLIRARTLPHCRSTFSCSSAACHPGCSIMTRNGCGGG